MTKGRAKRMTRTNGGNGGYQRRSGPLKCVMHVSPNGHVRRLKQNIGRKGAVKAPKS